MNLAVFLLTLSVAATGWVCALRDDAKLAKEFAVNLDLPPSSRWDEITEAHKIEIENLLKLIKTKVPKVLAEAVSVVSERIDKYVPYPYNEEIVGTAKVLNSSVADVLFANLFYELTAYEHDKATKAGDIGCTSIVAETVSGSVFHARNMDYSLVKYLQNLTVTVHFQKGGKTVYTGTTFAGYVGLVTGQKPYKYTISLDERNKGKLWMNLAEVVLSEGLQGAVAFRVRDVLNRDDLSFDDAVKYLANKPLIAPGYIIMGGANSGEGVVITRDRLASLDQHKLDVSGGTWYVLETNYDRWTTPPPTDDRRDPAVKAMNDLTRDGVGGQNLINVLSIPPVFNHKTTYTVVMSAASPDIYKTWVRYYEQ